MLEILLLLMRVVTNVPVYIYKPLNTVPTTNALPLRPPLFGLFYELWRGRGGSEAGREVIIAWPSSENGQLMLKIPRLPSALGGRSLGVKAAGICDFLLVGFLGREQGSAPGTLGSA